LVAVSGRLLPAFCCYRPIPSSKEEAEKAKGERNGYIYLPYPREDEPVIGENHFSDLHTTYRHSLNKSPIKKGPVVSITNFDLDSDIYHFLSLPINFRCQR